MASYMKQAKRAEAEGDYLKAGDLYLMAERSDEALEAFLRGGLYGRAAEVMESQGRPLEAADLFIRARDHAEAARIFAKVGDVAREAEQLELSGACARAAARLLEAGMGSAAALIYQRMGQLEKAAELFHQNANYQEAAEIYEELWQRESQAGPSFDGGPSKAGPFARHAAYAYARAGQFDRAAFFFLKEGLYEKAALCYLKAGERYQAAREFRRIGKVADAIAALEGEKGTLKEDAAGVLAELYIETGQAGKAGQVLERAHRMGEAAAAFQKDGQIEKAASLYAISGDQRKAAELFTQCGRHAEAGRCLRQAGLYQAACNAFEDAGLYEEAAEMACQSYEEMRGGATKAGRAQLLGAGKRAADLSARVGRDDRAAEIYAGLGFAGDAAKCYERAGQLAKAAEQLVILEEFATALRLYEKAGIRPPPAVLAAALAEAGKHAEAARAYEEAGEDERALAHYETAGLHLEAGRVLSRRNDHARAAECFERGGALALAAEAHGKAGNEEKAAECFERAGDYPRAAELHQKAERWLPAGRCLISAGRKDEAIPALQRVAPADAGWKEACLSLGDLFREKGLHPLAIEKYQKGLEGRQPDASILPFLYGLGLSWEKLRKPEEARSRYERILSIDYNYRDVKERYTAAAAPPSAVPAQAPPAPTASEPLALPPLPDGELQPGTVIADRYEIRTHLGSGSSGRVYRATDRDLEEDVALKILRRDAVPDAAAEERYAREIKLARAIAHPNVARVFDVGRFRGILFASMELVDGPTLEAFIRERKTIELGPAVRLLKPMLSGLQAAHEQGILHGRLTARSVLLAEGATPKLVGFGAVRALPVDGEGATPASIQYMAPEQIEKGIVDKRVDVYAVGAITYLLVTGREPHTERTRAAILRERLAPPRTWNQDIPDWLETIVTRCLQREPSLRYQSVTEMIAHLDAAIAHAVREQKQKRQPDKG